MAFLDKVKDVTNKVADTTSDAVGTAKYKMKIKNETKEMNMVFARLGKMYYEKYLDGEALLPEAEALVPEIKAHEEAITIANQKIKDLEENDVKIV